MSLEHDLKETLTRHADDAHPNTRAFSQVEAGVRRSMVRRTAASAVLGLAILVAAGITVPQLITNGPTEGSFADPSASPSAPTDGWTSHRSDPHGLTVAHPADWEVRGFEGSLEFNPPGEPGSTLGEPTFAVEFMLLYGESYNDAPGYRPAGDIAGRPAVLRQTDLLPGQTLEYRVDWTGVTCPPDIDCGGDPATLQIFILASDDDRWETWGDLALLMLGTIEILAD